MSTSRLRVGICASLAQLFQTIVLPLEILEKILSYVDAETLLSCEEVSPEFAAAVQYLSSKSLWKKSCIKEITRRDIELQIVSKLYPHHPHFDCPKTWKEIFKCWCRLKKMTTIKTWNITVLSLGSYNSQVMHVATHGNLILALIKFRRSQTVYNKIVTINENDDIIDKSCHFHSDTVYLTQLEGQRLDEDNILLSCQNCKLIGIPTNISHVRRKNPPKVGKGTNKINVYHSNGEVYYFKKCFGLLDKSKCGSIKETTVFTSSTCFVRVSCEFSNMYISCEDVYREFLVLQALHSKITSSKFFASILFLGTETGMVYGYYCKDKYDISHLELTKYTWSFNLSSRSIVSIDVLVSDKQFAIVCCDSKSIYKLVP